MRTAGLGPRPSRRYADRAEHLATRPDRRVHGGLADTLADGKPAYLGGRSWAYGAPGLRDP